MSDLERAPEAVTCQAGDPCDGVSILEPRDVPLGGLRSMDVRRTLPQRERSLIGAWCFLDHYGPDHVAATGGMNVARHPHTGLATVSWLFSGAVEHIDSAGHQATVRPGELNLMTAGRGISHSEFSTPETDLLHGAQLWLALPDAARGREPDFEHYAPEPITGEGAELRVFLGSLGGSMSPVVTDHPTLGAEILLEPGAEIVLDLDPSFEHGVLLDDGDLWLDDETLPRDHLAYLPTGRDAVVLSAGETRVRALIIGGEPFPEKIVMWWNFVGRAHEEIVAHRAAWQAEIGADPAPAPEGGEYDDGAPYPRFGTFPEGTPAPLPAPEMPHARLRAREQ
ncbi:pirin [Kocuria polaris]|nr:pirin [Kocuria polaris]